MKNKKRRYIIYPILLLVIVSLSVGFSALQKQLYVNDINMEVRLHEDVRVSKINLSSSAGNAVANFEDFNKAKLYGNVTFPSTSSYVLYKVDLTNYGNIKSGLLKITNNVSGTNYQICNSSGGSCTTNTETPVCNGSNCTLGSTKEIYVKITSTSSGTKNVDLDFDFEPYNDVTYNFFQENTSSFKKEIMSNDTYTLTLTSKPEEIELTGSADLTYNKNTGVLVISNIASDIVLNAKYKATALTENYTGTNPNNYVRFNNTLYRIIEKENIDDGYGNTELRAKIISNSSIGNNQFDDDSNDFSESTLKDVLNTTYYNGLSSEAKDLIDTAAWTSDYAGYIGLIDSGDYTDNSSWLNKQQFTLTSSENNKVKAVGASGLVDSDVTVSKATYPVTYLKPEVLIVGGTGTSSDPYILELQSGGTQSNPTVIAGRTLTVTGSNQELVTVTNKVGTVYYSLTTSLNESNYSSSGSTTIPSRSSVDTYYIYYYIPSWNNYKAKSGRVTSRINGRTYVVTYTKGANISSIGKEMDSCTTSGSSLTCQVTLPSITPSEGYESGKWSDGSNYYNPGAAYTLNANGKTLTASVSGKTYVATFNKNGVTSIGSTCTSSGTNTCTMSCMVTSGNSCTITLPSITRDGFTIDGWNTNSNATSGQTGAVSLTGNITYYAITHKDITVTFYRNGNTSQTPSGGSANTGTSLTQSCTIRNTQTTCNITSPAIAAPSGFSVNGYSLGATTYSNYWTVNTSKSFDSNAEYYAQSNKAAVERKMTLYRNGNTNFKYNGVTYTDTSKTFTICTIPEVHNGATQSSSCSSTITMATITAPSGFTNIGWSSGASNRTAVYTSGQTNVSLTMDADKSFYAQSSKAAIDRTMTLYRNGNTNFKYNGTTYTDTSKTFTICTIAAVYNGEAQSSSCSATITMATITPASGFTNIGWSTGSTVRTAVYTSGQTNVSLTMDANKTYYAQSSKAAIDRTMTLYRNGNTNFKYNGTTYTDTSKTFTICTIAAVYNGATQASSCSATITMATITAASGFTNIGWSSGATNRTAVYTSGQTNVSLTMDANKTYYAQSSKAAIDRTMTLYRNGNINFKYNGTTYTDTSKTFTICTIAAVYNGETQASSCSATITMATITPPSGFTNIGWSSGATNRTAVYTSGQTNVNITMGANKTYYAQSTKVEKTVTITFNANGNTISTTNGTTTTSTTRTCTIAATYNGEEQSETCNVTSPTITPASGFTKIGFSDGANNYTSSWSDNTSKAVSTNGSYFAQSKKVLSASFVLVDSNAATLSSNSSQCTVYNGESNCTITAPTVTPKSGYVFDGWSTTNGGTQTTTSFSPGGTYYTVTHKATGFTATFVKNGADSIGETSLSCSLYNGATSCKVTAPSITRSGFTVDGWSTNASATSGTAVGANITLSANATYNALTHKDITITFNRNGNTSQTVSGGSASTANTVTQSCTIRNSATTCSVTSPTIAAPSGFTVNGYSTGATTYSDYWTVNTSKSFSANTTYYAQSTKAAINRTITFYRNGNTNFKYNGNTYTDTSKSFTVCTIDAVHNGASQGTSCTGTITMATITAPSGFTVLGWSSGASNRTIDYESGESSVILTMSSNKSYYAQSIKAAIERKMTLYKNDVTSFTYSGTTYTDSSKTFTMCTIAAVYNGATQSTSCSKTITMASITVAAGYTAKGWAESASSSTIVYTSGQTNVSLTMDADKSFYAIKEEIPIVFSDKTITVTYSTSAQTVTNGIDAATGGSGSYTYSIVSGNTNNYFSLSGRNITVAANTPANTTGYQITIKATDASTPQNATATYTIKVNKKQATLGLSSSITLTYPTAQTIDYTYDGDGTVSCSSADQTYVTCSVNTSTKKLTLTPVKKTSSAVSVTLSATAGTNYSVPASKSISVTVNAGTITGSVSISGTATWGQTLTANPSCTTPSTGCTFGSYQWYSNGSAISGATSSTYAIPKEQVGKTITVSVVASATNYNNKTFTSSATSAVAKQSLSVTKTNYNAAYDTNPHSVVLKVTSQYWDGNIVSGTSTNYGNTVVTGGSYNTNYTLSPTYTNVTSSKTVYYKVTGGSYYNDVTGSGTVVITQKKATITPASSTKALTYPTAGTVTYTYDGDGTVSCNSANTSYVTCSVNTSTKTVTLTPVKKTSSAINVTLSATAGTNYSAPDNKTISVTVAAGTCNPPTNVSIGTDGKVTWTTSSNATGYQISIDNSTFTSASSGVNYLSTIILATGTRTVYVRSVCDSNLYAGNSSNATASVTVYSVTLTGNTGISDVSGAGNYIKNATVTLGATVKNGYTWSKWTQTSGGSQVSTTQAYSGTITSNWSYTANATITNPATPTISGGGTNVYGNTRTLTCATTTTYASGITKYYSFGYSATDGGTPSNWTTASTTATYSVPFTYYVRYYSCRVYVTDGTQTSTTVSNPTNADALVSYVNARIDFDATTNSGTLSGTSPLYVQYGSTLISTGRELMHNYTSAYPSATKTGNTFIGWYTSATGGSKVIDANGVVQANVSGWTNSNKEWQLTNSSDTQNTNRLYARFSGNTVTATFYYNSNTTCGSSTITTATAQCTISSGTSCTVTIPSAVTNSKGKYNSSYINVSTSFNSMSAASLTISDDTTYYAYYSSSIKVYYPSSATAVSSTSSALYRNEVFTSNSNIKTVTATSATSTSQASSITISGIYGTFSGINASVNSSSYVSISSSDVVSSCTTTYYAVSLIDDTVTFKYNSNNTCGSNTLSTATEIVSTKVYCSSTSTISLSRGTTSNVPTAVSSSVGKYNGNYRAVGNVNSLTQETTFTGGNTYYAIYSTPISIRQYNGSAYSSYTYYRNEYIAAANETNYTSSINSTATSNSIPELYYYGPNDSIHVGFTTQSGGNILVIEFVNLNATAKSCQTSFNAVYQFQVTFQKGSNVSEIGATTGLCNTISTSCTVVLPSITVNSGYLSAGWNTTNGATTGTAEGADYTVTSNITLYANAIQGKYKNTTTNTGYMTLADAFADVASNQTIQVVSSNNDSSTPVLASSKTGVTLNLNGKTVTLSHTLTNNGGLTISGTGKITGSMLNLIENNGTLTKSGNGTLENTMPMSIVNDEVTDATRSSVIVNNSSLSVTAGTFTCSYRCILNNENGIANITGGTFTSGRIGLNNLGTSSTTPAMYINNISVTTESNAVVNTSQGGQVVIDGGTFTGNCTISTGNTPTILNSESSTGTITINGGNITSASSRGVSQYRNNNGTIIINGGTISGGGSQAVDVYGGTLKILGGTITGTTGYGVASKVLEGSDTVPFVSNLIIGTNESTPQVSQTVPSILGQTYGVFLQSNDVTFKFYDGIIHSNGSQGSSINLTVDETPAGYTVQKTYTSGSGENAILVAANYENSTQGKYYLNLNDALSEAQSNNTIKVLQNNTQTTAASLASGKTGVTFDLNGKTVTLSNSITNNGGLTISGSGTLTSSKSTIKNNGTLAVTGSSLVNMLNITTSSSSYLYSAIENGSSSLSTATLTLNNYSLVDSTVDCSNCTDDTKHKGTIISYGTLNISGGSVNYSGFNNLNDDAIINYYNMNMTSGSVTNEGISLYQGQTSTGTVNISGGLIESSAYDAINTASSATVRISGTADIYGKSAIHMSSTNTGNVVISGGSVSSFEGAAVHVTYSSPSTQGSLTVSGGSISGPIGIYVGSADCPVTVTGGTISGETTGIYVRANTSLTLGTNDSFVSTTTPFIKSTNTSDSYGVDNYGTFNFYDGKISSSSGANHAINGTVTNIPTDATIEKTVVSGVETAVLSIPNQTYNVTLSFTGTSGTFTGNPVGGSFTCTGSSYRKTCTLVTQAQNGTNKIYYNGSEITSITANSSNIAICDPNLSSFSYFGSNSTNGYIIDPINAQIISGRTVSGFTNNGNWNLSSDVTLTLYNYCIEGGFMSIGDDILSGAGAISNILDGK